MIGLLEILLKTESSFNIFLLSLTFFLDKKEKHFVVVLFSFQHLVLVSVMKTSALRRPLVLKSAPRKHDFLIFCHTHSTSKQAF